MGFLIIQCIMQYLILYAFLAALCFFGVKINDSKSEKVLTIQANANLLRGVFAIFIIYTHCTLAFENLPIVLIPLRKVSTFGVGYFFILSGYGLAYSFGKKENYLKGFLSGKLTKIAVPALVSCIISLVAEHFFLSYDLTILKIFTSMNWCIYSLIVLYIVFYLVYKFMPSRFGRVIGMLILTVVITVLIAFVVKGIGQKITGK
ncbi:Acyltransferase family protein [Pseudobutyrivibrio sp. 49]|uniref:acyltransferase family protein n=1 Tax=Pseudobutyrivibrio sp. 49 TaxID=1855344 RepID=UPI00088F4727|nr:acyltransferase family protein [Pseudobutyrivibrio sp. 49]SDI71984.1 Acyltransferase family protein [Pseudobutyrivibrio sp. 49]